MGFSKPGCFFFASDHPGNTMPCHGNKALGLTPFVRLNYFSTDSIYFPFSGTLLGLNQAVAKDCLSSHCRAVAMHAGKKKKDEKMNPKKKKKKKKKNAQQTNCECACVCSHRTKKENTLSDKVQESGEGKHRAQSIKITILFVLCIHIGVLD
jgi:hypothetical protein